MTVHVTSNLHSPYNGNLPWKKSFVNFFLCHSLQENFHDSGNLIYKNSGQDKKCQKTFAIASRFAKFANFFFYGQMVVRLNLMREQEI